MICFSVAQYAVAVGLILVALTATWFVSAHFERSRDLRRRIKRGEEVTLSRQQKKLVDREENALGQIRNLIRARKIHGLTFATSLFGQGVAESELRLLYHGHTRCTIYCSARYSRLNVIDHTTMTNYLYHISQVEEAVEYALYNFRNW